MKAGEEGAVEIGGREGTGGGSEDKGLFEEVGVCDGG